MQGCAKPTLGDFPFFALYKAWQSFNHDFDQNLGNRHLETHLALNIPHSEKSLWSLRNEIRCLFDLPSTYNSQIAGKPTTQRLLISAIRMMGNGGKITCSCLSTSNFDISYLILHLLFSSTPEMTTILQNLPFTFFERRASSYLWRCDCTRYET